MLTRCVILDLDDTLFLERDYVISGFTAVGAHVAARFGRTDFAQTAIALFEGGVRGTTFNQTLAQLGISPTDDLISELLDVYRRHVPAIALLPDAQRLISRLSGRYIGVVTDGPPESQRAKADAVGAPDWAQLVVYTAELGVGFGKPHERGFAIHEEQTGLAGDQFTYIADNPTKDFAGPKARGWTTIRVRRPESLHAALASGHDVDVELASLDDVTA